MEPENENKKTSQSPIEIYPEKKETRSEKLGKGFWELARFIAISAIIIIPIRYYIAQPFVVSGASMEPSFRDGEYLIVDEISYRFDKPQRGDVIIFRSPIEKGRYLIKRIIGLPYETLEIFDNKIVIINSDNPEGFSLGEDYVKNKVLEEEKTIILGEKEYYVLGDNRPVSADSRIWGPLSKENIVGKPLFRLFPLTKLSVWPGK